jgi:phosphoglycerate dehydrogenase-like enzyme
MAKAEHLLRVVVATPLSEQNCELVEKLEPRIDLVRNQSLLPPMRHAADFSGDPAYKRTPSQQSDFEAMLDSADALYGLPDVSPAALKRTVDANPQLRWVHAMAAGGGGQVAAANLDQVQLERVAFTTSAGVHGRALTEFALLGVLAGAKQLPKLTALQHAHKWSDRFMMGQVSQQTILVVGLGGIGRQVADALAALGAIVIGVSRHDVDLQSLDRVIRPEQIVEIAPEIDAVVAALPGTAATEGLLGAAFFAALKPGATVVNVGRGAVIDEAAMTAALVEQRVGFAALDVFSVEPLPLDSALWDLPNVLLSPHTAALSADEDQLIAELFAKNASRLIDGRPLINLVDTLEFY